MGFTNNEDLKILGNQILIILANGEKDLVDIVDDPQFPKNYSSNLDNKSFDQIVKNLQSNNEKLVLKRNKNNQYGKRESYYYLSPKGEEKAKTLLKKTITENLSAPENESDNKTFGKRKISLQTESESIDNSKKIFKTNGDKSMVTAIKRTTTTKKISATKKISTHDEEKDNTIIQETKKVQDYGKNVDFKLGDKTFKFRLTNGEMGSINLDKCKILQKNTRELLDSVIEYRQVKMFAGVDLTKLSEEYSFEPFKYQIDNVDTMLNRFEGKGVFGDQVGLGKTVEALMTAHAMFKCGVIKNALIVVPGKTKEGWKSEIESKFNGVFTINDIEEPFVKTLENIKKDNIKDNIKDNKKNRLYIVSSNKVKSYNSKILAYQNINAPLSKEEEDFFNNLTIDRWQDIPGILENQGFIWDEYTRWDKEVSVETPEMPIFDNWKNMTTNQNMKNVILNAKGYVLIHPTIAKYDKLIGIFESFQEMWNGHYYNSQSFLHRSLYDINDDLYVHEYIDCIIEKLNKSKKAIKDLYKDSSIDSLIEDYSIDLLIVDEVHDFYNQTDSNNKIDNIKQMDEDIKNYVKLLSNIKKKFCILISATPIRYKLSDIYDLCYIVDKDKFGKNDDEREEYFYKTVCQLEDNDRNEFSLAKMIKNPDSKDRLFSMINSFFTRKRISQVSEDMKGCDKEGKEIKYYFRSETNKKILIKNRSLIYLQTIGYAQDTSPESVYTGLSQNDYNNWMNNTTPEIELNRQNNHWYSAIDVTLKEIANEKKEGSNKKGILKKIDWRRRGKKSIVCDPNIQYDDNDNDWINLSNIDNLSETHKSYLKDLNNLPKILNRIQDNNRDRDIDVRAFSNTFSNDKVLLYVSRNNVSGFNIGIRSEIEKRISSRPCEVLDKIDPNDRLSIENYNRIDIVNQSFQAGVNMQDYKTLVFMQMDLSGERLLEPVDIEQWIGRIYRTGQVKNCRVITILRTYFINDNRNPDIGFLKWYYEILSDPEGLDLYGENTPDVAFLQPIVTDMLKEAICETINSNSNPNKEPAIMNTLDINDKKNIYIMNKNTVKFLQKRAKFIRNNDVSVNDYRFSELLGLCFYADQIYKQFYNTEEERTKEYSKEKLQEDLKSKIREFSNSGKEIDRYKEGEWMIIVKNTIRNICEDERFGKKSN